MTVFLPYIFLIFWFVLLMAIGWIKDYKKSLIANMLAALSFSIHAFLIEQYVATAMYLIAMGSSLIQFLLPESEDLGNKRIRNGIAILCAVTASAILYDKPADILPCLAISFTRLGEAQQSMKLFKAAFAAGFIFMISFGLLEELYFMASLHSIIAVTFLYRLYKG